MAKNPKSSSGVSRSRNLGIIGILKRPTLAAVVTKMWEFQEEISHNLVYIGAMAKNRASSSGVQGRET